MEEEDKEFFILVLGVLAAVIMVISWWFTTGAVAVSAAQIRVPAAAADTTQDIGDQDGGDQESTSQSSGNQQDENQNTDGADDQQAGDEEEDVAASADDVEPAPTAAVISAPTVFDAIVGSSELSVVSGLLRDESLDAVLVGDGPFTVFAPTNDAVNRAAESDATIAVLQLARQSVLTYHVVAGTYSVEELMDIARGSRSTELTTVQGEPISLALEGNKLVINGNAVVGTVPVLTSNGWVHTLDNVLVPPVAALNTLVGVEPILFGSGSATIDAASFPTLDLFIAVLQGNTASVTIEGHTDSSGDPVLNQNLSQSRARSVLNYLVANGVDESRLSAEGFGSSNAVADNDTEEGRALNRRIEFTLD